MNNSDGLEKSAYLEEDYESVYCNDLVSENGHKSCFEVRVVTYSLTYTDYTVIIILHNLIAYKVLFN